jgi:phosphonatase-like hydrolase
MSAIQLVVFDIAGTTVQDKGDVADAFMNAFRDFEIEVPLDDVKKVMGFRKVDAIAILLEKFAPEKKDDELLIDRIHTRFTDLMIAFYRDDEGLRPFPNAEKIFGALKKKGIKIALNTGFTRPIADTILHRLRWDDRLKDIDRVICSDEVPQGRPYPDMIKALAQELHIASTAEVAKVGDTEVDVEEGRNAGCGLVVSVTTGAYTRAQLEKYGPDAIIDDLQELMPLIENKV